MKKLFKEVFSDIILVAFRKNIWMYILFIAFRVVYQDTLIYRSVPLLRKFGFMYNKNVLFLMLLC